MTTKLVAAETIRTLATRYKDMVEVADLLESIGSIEQASAEAKTACKKAQAERDKALSLLDQAKNEIQAAEGKKDEILSGAEDELKEIIKEAEDQADSIVIDAQNKATAMSEALAQTIKADTDAHADEMTKLRSKRAALAKKVEQLDTEKNILTEQVGTLQAKLEAIKAEASSMFK